MRYYTDLDIYGHLALELSTNNNANGAINNAPTANLSHLKFTGDSPVVSGFADGGENNKILFIFHSGTGNLTLKNLSVLSNSKNQIVTGYGRDVSIKSGDCAILIYDVDDYLWKIVSLPNEIKNVIGTENQISVSNTDGDITLSLPQDINEAAAPTFLGINLESLTDITIDANDNLKISSLGDITITPDVENGTVIIDSDNISIDETTGALVVNGGVGIDGAINASGTIYGNILASTQSTGDEGGQIELAEATTNSTLDGPIAIDIWRNRLRIFETTGNNRGVYIDLSAASNSIGTNLLSGAGISTDTLDDVAERGATTDVALTISNTTESTSRTTGALIISGGIGVAKRIQTKNLTVDGIKHRIGISPNLESGVIDLSTDDYLIYSIDQTDDFFADISFNNGTPGEIFYVKVKSDGQQYTWDTTNDEIKWPSDIIPSASAVNKTDLYHFICITSTLYLGTYVFNYT